MLQSKIGPNGIQGFDSLKVHVIHMEYISFINKKTNALIQVRADAVDKLKEYRESDEYMEYFEGANWHAVC